MQLRHVGDTNGAIGAAKPTIRVCGPRGWCIVHFMGYWHEQCGVLSVAQARTFMTRGQIRARLEAGSWQRPYRSVLVTHNGALSGEQRLWACLLAAPSGSALAGPTAAQLGGLYGFESSTVWLVVPHNQQPPRGVDAVLLRSSQLSPVDMHSSRVPRRTTIERSVLDMAIRAPTPAMTRAPLLAAVQQRLTVPDRLTGALSRRGNCPHRRLIVETIADAAGGVHSLPEREFAQIIRNRGLPEPARQRVVRRRGGHYYLDADWPELGLSAEVHGIPHLQVRQWDADLDRFNELTISGRHILQFSSYAVRHMSERVGDQLERAIQLRASGQAA